MQTYQKDHAKLYNKKKVFVGCIPGDVDESSLKRFFKSIGNIMAVEIKYKSKKVNAGYCIIQCSDTATYEKFLNEEIYFEGRRLECRPQMEKAELEKYKREHSKRRIYVYNILAKTKDSELKTLFERNIGPVESAYCIRKEKRSKNGLIFGYVLFEKIEDAKKAVEFGKLNLRGQIIKINEFIDKQTQNRVNEFRGNYNNSFIDFPKRNMNEKSEERTGSNGHSFENLNCCPPLNFQNRANDSQFYQNLNSMLFSQRMPNFEFSQNLAVTPIPRIKKEICPCVVKKPASVIVSELLKPIWRNHNRENIRENW